MGGCFFSKVETRRTVLLTHTTDGFLFLFIWFIPISVGDGLAPPVKQPHITSFQKEEIRQINRTTVGNKNEPKKDTWPHCFFLASLFKAGGASPSPTRDRVRSMKIKRLPCVKGTVERMRDWGIVLHKAFSFTIPPSFSCENATSLYTREAKDIEYK